MSVLSNRLRYIFNSFGALSRTSATSPVAMVSIRSFVFTKVNGQTYFVISMKNLGGLNFSTMVATPFVLNCLISVILIKIGLIDYLP